MAVLVGTPHTVVGEASGSCVSAYTVPDPCVTCRQVQRWMPRTVAWTTSAFSRFKSIMQTILEGHDEVLKSLCGFCAEQTVKSCDCNFQQYLSLGLSKTIQIQNVDACLVVTQTMNLTPDCYIECLPNCIDCVKIVGPDPAMPTVWTSECATLCGTCQTITLDPCNNPVHLDMMMRASAAEIKRGFKPGTGPNIVAVLSVLFPGSVPQIMKTEFGKIYVTLGRVLTADERKFWRFLVSFVPLGLGVQLFFITPA
jgi:hypothetical protein